MTVPKAIKVWRAFKVFHFVLKSWASHCKHFCGKTFTKMNCSTHIQIHMGGFAVRNSSNHLVPSKLTCSLDHSETSNYGKINEFYNGTDVPQVLWLMLPTHFSVASARQRFGGMGHQSIIVGLGKNVGVRWELCC